LLPGRCIKKESMFQHKLDKEIKLNLSRSDYVAIEAASSN